MSAFTTGVRSAARSHTTGLKFGTPGALDFLSWQDVENTGRAVTGSLLTHGVEPGDCIGVLAGEANDVAALSQGAWGAGAAFSMLQQPTPNTDLTEWQQGTMQSLRMLRARVVVIGEPFHVVGDALRDNGFEVIAIPPAWPDYHGAVYEPADDDVALYQLTSGSTGQPKGARVTHGNLHANAMALQHASLADPASDVAMSWLPLSHDMGLVGFLLTPMYYGVPTIHVAPSEFLRAPLSWIQILSDEHATLTAAPNFAYSIVHRRLKAVEDGVYDLSALRFALCGAEPIDPTTVEEFVRQASRFGMSPSAVVAAYGMAEATLGVAFAPLGQGLRTENLDAHQLETKGFATEVIDAETPAKEVVLIGPPLLGIDATVVDDAGTVLGPRRLGEILIRGDAITSQYATEDGDRSALDDNGWLHTGDLGYFTDCGQLAVCGRRKNVIIVAGRNIFPADLERLAETAEGVRRGSVAAFGVALPNNREDIRIVAETTTSYDEDAQDDIRRQIARKVYNHTGLSPKVLIVPRGAIPKTASGKIRHVTAKELFGGVR